MPPHMICVDVAAGSKSNSVAKYSMQLESLTFGLPMVQRRKMEARSRGISMILS